MKKIESNAPSGFNFGLMKSKKGMVPVLMSLLAIVGAVVLIGGVLSWAGVIKLSNPTGDEALNIRQTNQGTQDRLNDAASTAAASGLPPVPSTGLTQFDFIAVNPNDDSGTTDWNAVSVKVQEQGTNNALKSYTTDADGTFASASMDLTYGKKYNAWVVVSQNTTGSAGPFTIDTKNYGAAGDLTIDVPDFDHIRLKSCYDEINRGAMWNNQDVSAAGTTIDLATTGSIIYSTTNATATALGNSDNFEMSCKIDVADYKQWGDVRNFVIVDADASDYENVGVKIDGKKLEEVGKSVLHDDDQGYLSAYEEVFHMPMNIKAEDMELVLTAETKSTGTVDADMKMRFISEVYRVAENGRGIEKRVFNSAGTELYQTPAAESTIDIS